MEFFSKKIRIVLEQTGSYCVNKIKNINYRKLKISNFIQQIANMSFFFIALYIAIALTKMSKPFSGVHHGRTLPESASKCDDKVSKWQIRIQVRDSRRDRKCR